LKRDSAVRAMPYGLGSSPVADTRNEIAVGASLRMLLKGDLPTRVHTMKLTPTQEITPYQWVHLHEVR